MSKKILINVMHPEEARVAIVEDGRLVELDIEVAGSEQTRGNVYKGVVVRVEPGLQAAFVDIGLKKLGFLQMGELHPDFWQWRDDVPEEQRKRRPRIQEVLRRGQDLLVQVEKGERDMKGAALTTYVSLPGRYMVLMPGSDSAGISRKVENEAERKKLKELASQLEIPEGIGYIIRTEALGKTKTDLNKDLKSLLKLNEEIRAKAAKSKAPALIYQELDLVIRTIRDYFTAQIDEVLVDSPEVYKQAQGFFKRTMPKFESLVKLHQEKRPIFSKYQLEEQIDQIHEKKVLLKSGGSLVIEPTEALVSIDVNSGKSTGEKGVEDTAYKTNMEAAEESARQLRLRDLGGLIVIDFIDMRDKKHMSEVEKTLKNALKADKARVTVGRISQFGMLEMSRQRIKPTLSEASYLACPHCEGRGKVKSVENMAISFLRKVHAAAAKGTASEVRGNLPLEVAYYLLNRKKRELVQIENDYDIEVTVKGKPSFLMNQLDLELLRREKPLPSELPLEHAVETPIFAEEAEEVEEVEEEQPEAAGAPDTEEGKGKKKRRRKKKGKGESEATQSPEVAGADEETSPGEPAADVALLEVAGSAAHEEQQTDEHKKKRRRRKKRGPKSPLAEGAVPEAEGEVATATMDAQEPVAEMMVGEGGGETLADENKKKRRRRKRRGPKGLPGEGTGEESRPGETAVASALTTEPEAPAGEPKAVAEGGASPEEHKKKRRRRKRGGEKPAPTEGAAEGTVLEQPRPEPVPAVAALPEQLKVAAVPAKKLPRTTRKKTVPASPAETPLPVMVAELLPAAVVEPKKKGGRKVTAPKAVETMLPEAAVVVPEKKVRSRKTAVPKLPEARPAAAEDSSPEPKPQRKRSVRSKKEPPAEEPSGE